jgi:hypothetical protein
MIAAGIDPKLPSISAIFAKYILVVSRFWGAGVGDFDTAMMDTLTLMGHLTLRLTQDDDGTGELFADFSANGFAGKGSAWFGLRALAAFAKELSQYPLPRSEPVTLAGGYWSSDEPKSLEQEHFHISVFPIGGVGVVGAHLRASTDFGPDERMESRHYAGVELKTDYNELEKFSNDLRALLRGDRNEATLNEVEI